MQVSKHIHALRIPFKLQVGPNKTLERFVNVYLVFGKRAFLIDSAVSGSKAPLFDYIKSIGHEPDEIETLVFTHAHPDHTGGALGVQRAIKCRVAAHAADVPWIEDVERQYRERPVPSFHSVMEGPVKVDLLLKDGDSLELGDGLSLKVIHTPGHSRGHIALFCEQDGALISGDSVPVAGHIPIYEDVLSTVRTLKKLRGIPGLEALLSSWDEPRCGDRVYKSIDEGIGYVQRIHREVLREKVTLGSQDVETIGAGIGKFLGLPAAALNPLFFKTIEAHLKAADYEDLTSL